MILEKANSDFRIEMAAAKIPLWCIGDALGVGELTVIRRLHHELPAEEKQIIRDIIKTLKGE